MKERFLKKSIESVFDDIFIILRHIVYHMGANSSSQIERFVTRYLPIAFTMFLHVSECEFFNQIVVICAVECDWTKY